MNTSSTTSAVSSRYRHPVVWLVAMILCGVTTSRADEEATSKSVIGPSNVPLHEGALALMNGDGEEGVRLTLRGLKLAGGGRELKVAHSNLCAGFLLIDQLETALEHCNWVIEKDPNHWRTYNNRALVYLRMKRFEESEADIAKGQSLRPESSNLKEVKGMYLDEVDPVAEHITIDDRREGAETD